MTPTERARRSDALYYDTESVARRCLCDMIANRESDLEDARAENARLRDGAYAMRQLYEDELKHALADNAKLRELVKDMWGTMGLLDACAVDEYDEPLNCCTVCNQYGRVDELVGGKRVIGCKLMYRMRELGVEVEQ